MKGEEVARNLLIKYNDDYDNIYNNNNNNNDNNNNNNNNTIGSIVSYPVVSEFKGSSC